MGNLLRRARNVLICTVIGCASLCPSAYAVPPGVAGVLSVVPGLGQVTDGEPLEGLAWFAVTVPVFFFGPNQAVTTIGLDLWMYNMYDAYRDAGAKKAAKYNVFQNYIAAFNPLNLFDPIGAGAIAYQAAVTIPGSPTPPPSNSLPTANKLVMPISTSFIALGEESLFRGFVFPGFSDLTHSTVVGAVTSSLAFAAAHSLYQGQSSYAFQPSIFTFRAVLGLAYCLQTWIHDYDFRKSIFSHTWVDFIAYEKDLGMFGSGPPQEAVAFGLRFDL